MEYVSYFFRFIYRIKWWLIFIPLFVTFYVIYKTRNLPRTYEVKTTIYTGVMSGFNISADGAVQNINVVNNTIDNLINIITAQSTLRKVSMRLFAQHMMYGDVNKDNTYIQAKNFRHLLTITPKPVQDLIDKTSEEKTVRKLFTYADTDTENFLYGLFNWAPPYYSYHALSQVGVKRLGNSDMIEIKYATDDPGVTFHTLLLLNEEFMKQYEGVQFGETDKVIHFFEDELNKTGAKLKISEDSLTNYNIKKRIVNYDEQTKHLAALSRDFQLQQEEIFLQFNSSQALVAELEKRLGDKIEVLRNNALFITKLQEISDLTARIAEVETFRDDSVLTENRELTRQKEQLKKKEDDFKAFSDAFNLQKNSKEGYPNIDLIAQWLTEVLKLEETRAKLDVMDRWQEQLDDEYVYYSPIGSTIKRKEREINFTEASYLEILHSLNTARLRQKSLQMNSATLRVLNPPTYPLGSASTKRKMKVITAALGTFIFVFGYFLLVEILDHTLRDKIRTERITNGKVIGAFPGGNKLRHRGYTKSVNAIAAKVLGNALLGFSSPGNGLFVNLISTERQEGKTFLANQLLNYFSSINLKTRYYSWHDNFSPDSGQYLFANSLKDFLQGEDQQVTIIEYPPLNEAAIPGNLLRDANINLLIVRSTRTWKDADRVLFRNLKSRVKESPLFMVLNKTKREEAEYFTGLLPPYTYIRKLTYRFFQLGLTSKE